MEGGVNPGYSVGPNCSSSASLLLLNDFAFTLKAVKSLSGPSSNLRAVALTALLRLLRTSRTAETHSISSNMLPQPATAIATRSVLKLPAGAAASNDGAVDAVAGRFSGLAEAAPALLVVMGAEIRESTVGMLSPSAANELLNDALKAALVGIAAIADDTDVAAAAAVSLSVETVTENRTTTDRTTTEEPAGSCSSARRRCRAAVTLVTATKAAGTCVTAATEASKER